jgi:hypothetical protein
MPICHKCEHGARAHNWIAPACSRCGNRNPSCPFCYRNYQRGRKRGQCQYPGCTCRAYSPLTNQARPANKYTDGCCTGNGENYSEVGRLVVRADKRRSGAMWLKQARRSQALDLQKAGDAGCGEYAKWELNHRRRICKKEGPFSGVGFAKWGGSRSAVLGAGRELGCGGVGALG